MAEKLSWSVGVASPGGSINQSGSFDTEAVTIASISIDPATSKTLALPGDVAKLSFLAIKAGHYSDKLKVKAAGATPTEVKLNTGPLILFGDTLKLFGTSLAPITVTNEEPAAAAGQPAVPPATIEILIGQKLT